MFNFSLFYNELLDQDRRWHELGTTYSKPKQPRNEEKPDRVKSGFVIASIGLGVFLTCMWWNFYWEWTFFEDQTAAKCVDGRTELQPLNVAHFVVDDSKVDDRNRVTMRCGIPVAVYPCLNGPEAGAPAAGDGDGSGGGDGSGAAEEAEDDGDGDGDTDARRLDAEPPTRRLDAEPANLAECVAAAEPSSEWPTKEVDAGFICHKPNAFVAGGYHHCDSLDWTCPGVGACNGYEYARYQCASKINALPYFCWHAPAHNRAYGIKTEKVNEWDFTGWFVGAGWFAVFGSIGVLTLVVVCLGVCHRMAPSYQEALGGTVHALIATLVCVVFVMLIVWLISVAVGSGEQRHIEDEDYQKLETVMFANNAETGGTSKYAITPKDHMVESWKWWHPVLVWSMCSCGCICFVLGLASMCGVSGETTIPRHPEAFGSKIYPDNALGGHSPGGYHHIGY